MISINIHIDYITYFFSISIGDITFGNIIDNTPKKCRDLKNKVYKKRPYLTDVL